MIYLLIFALYCIQTHLLWWTLQKSFKRTGKWRQSEVMCSFNQLLKTYGRLIVIDSPELSSGPRTKRERKEKALQIIFLTNNLVKDFKSAFSNKDRHKRKYNEWHLIMWPKLFYTCQWFSKAISTVSLPLSFSLSLAQNHLSYNRAIGLRAWNDNIFQPQSHPNNAA